MLCILLTCIVREAETRTLLLYNLMKVKANFFDLELKSIEVTWKSQPRASVLMQVKYKYCSHNGDPHKYGFNI